MLSYFIYFNYPLTVNNFNMIIKKLSFTFTIVLYSIFLTISAVGYCEQAAEVEDAAVNQEGLLDGVERIPGSHEQDIARLESELSSIEKLLEKLRTIERKQVDANDDGNVLDLIIKQEDILEIRINTISESIRVRSETTEVVNNIKKVLEAKPGLSEMQGSAYKDASLLPVSQLESVQKESVLLGARLESVLAMFRDKEANYLTIQSKNDTTRLSLEEEKEKLRDEAGELTDLKPEKREERSLIDRRKSLLKSEIRLRDDKIKLLAMQTELAKLRLQSVQVQRSNIEQERDIKAKIADILSLKFKEAEDERKKKEAEDAKRAEEERRHIAEEDRAAAELEKKKALQEEEIAVQKQLMETSPEKKRILEVEADVHKQKGLVATIKGGVITVDTDKEEYLTELNKILEDIKKFFEGENTSGEIAAELDFINAESNRIRDKVKNIQSRLSAAEKQKAIINESLDQVRAELTPDVQGEKSIIEKEADGFSNIEQGKMLVKLANQRLKYIEEQKNLIEKEFKIGHELLGSSKDFLEKLTDAKGRLSEIRAANVWERRESRISTNTVIAGLSDIKILKDKPLDFYKALVQYLNKLSVYLSNTENIPVFIIKIIIIVFVVFFTFFARRLLVKWSGREIKRFAAITPRTFFTFEFLPGFLRIMQNTLTMFFLFVIALTISLTVPSNVPIMLSVIYGFAIISVYKFLKGIVFESFSPYTGERRWVPVTYSSARHIFRGLNTILLFSAIVITLVFVLNVFSYKKDVIELLWFIYMVVTIFLAIWIAASQRKVLLRILPYSESAIGKFVNKTINILYPLLIAFVILLFAIRSLGYALLTYTFVATLIESLIVSIIAYIIYRFILRRMLLSQDRRLKFGRQLEDEEFEFEKKSISLRFRIYKWFLDYGALIVVVIIIFRMWNDTFKDVVSSQAAPTLFRSIYENVIYVIVSIKNSLSYKFTLAEGRYTTPFKMLIGILVLIAAFVSTRYFKNVLRTRVYEKAQLEQGARHAISSGVTYFIIGVAALVGLNIAGIPLRSLTIFAGAFGIGLGFGMQNIINNLVSGIIIFFEKPIRIGDVITVDKDIAGKVEKISIRSTAVKTFDRKTVVVPNSKFLESNVVNWVHGGDMLLRSKIVVGVAYGSNTELVKNCLLEVVDAHPDVKKDPEPIVRFAEFGSSSLNFELFFWAHVLDRWMATSDLNFAIDKIFRENNIEIPFPQRDLHIRSGNHAETDFTTFINNKSKDKYKNIDLEDSQIDE